MTETMDAGLDTRPAAPADRPAVERLWLLFRHDLSAFGGQLPNPDGTFRGERLEAAFSGDPDWAPSRRRRRAFVRASVGLPGAQQPCAR
ncbi:hypothetical protein SALBM311S_02989 [Streptomyces alboniger]